MCSSILLYLLLLGYSLGIPDTSFKGLSTLTARSVLKSKSDPTVDKILRRKEAETEHVQSN